MDLSIALKGLATVQSELRTPQAVANPVIMSQHMMRLSVYVAAVEEHIADLEKKQELEEAHYYYKMKKEGKSPSAAEKEAKYYTNQERAEIKRLTRLVNSGWKQVGTIQSRVNHLVTESRSTNI